VKRKHVGSDFETLLAADGILEECRANAIKFMLSRALEHTMSTQNISKSEMARRLHTSRSGVDRLLDPENMSVTLHSLAKVATILGKRIEFTLV
jgi:antitoxin HicB